MPFWEDELGRAVSVGASPVCHPRVVRGGCVAREGCSVPGAEGWLVPVGPLWTHSAAPSQCRTEGCQPLPAMPRRWLLYAAPVSNCDLRPRQHAEGQ